MILETTNLELAINCSLTLCSMYPNDSALKLLKKEKSNFLVSLPFAVLMKNGSNNILFNVKLLLLRKDEKSANSFRSISH